MGKVEKVHGKTKVKEGEPHLRGGVEGGGRKGPRQPSGAGGYPNEPLLSRC